MSVKNQRSPARCLIAIAAAIAFCGPMGVAAANDAPIDLLLQNTGLNAQNARVLSAPSDTQTNRKIKNNSFALPDGTRITLDGGGPEAVSRINKITVTYPNGSTGFEQSVSDLKLMLGQPETGRGDLLVWKTPNLDGGLDQSRKITIVAGTHGPNKYVISINRRAKQRGRHSQSATQQNQRPETKPKVTTKTQPNRANVRSERLKPKRDTVEF